VLLYKLSVGFRIFKGIVCENEKPLKQKKKMPDTIAFNKSLKARGKFSFFHTKPNLK